MRFLQPAFAGLVTISGAKCTIWTRFWLKVMTSAKMNLLHAKFLNLAAIYPVFSYGKEGVSTGHVALI